jgi:hypothetical protein
VKCVSYLLAGGHDDPQRITFAGTTRTLHECECGAASPAGGGPTLDTDPIDVEEDDMLDRDPHGIWFPGEFRAAMEAALDSNLRKARLDGRAAERRSRREAARQLAAAVVVEEHRLEATPSIQLADWYSDAPRATGEEQDTFADEADEELRRAAEWLRENPEPSQTSEDWAVWLRTRSSGGSRST